MPNYIAGHSTFGSRFNIGDYYDNSGASKRRRLEATEDVLTAAGFPEAAGFLNEVADTLGVGDQEVPQSQLAASSSRGRHSSGQGRVSRKRPRKMARRWTRGRRKSFRQKVGRALLGFAETRRILDSVTQATFSAGDGTTRVLYIANPISQIVQGSTSEDITGKQFWIKAMLLRGRISLDQTTNTLRVRILLIKSRQFADLSAGFQTYGNTTTALTNPTQVAADGETNLRIFETSDAEEAAQPSAPFVGNASGIDIIDRDLVQVVGGREFFLSQQHLLNFQNVQIYVPINKKFKLYEEFGNTPTDQIRTVDGYNYYWIMQVFSNSNANNILVAQDILGTFDTVTYLKDI